MDVRLLSAIDASTFVQIDPTFDFRDSRNINETVTRTQEGELKSIVWDRYNRYTIPLTYVNSIVTSYINDLWINNTDVYLLLNFNTTSEESIRCRFINTMKPLGQKNRPYNDQWQGVLILQALTKEDVNSSQGVGPFILDSSSYGILDTNRLS